MESSPLNLPACMRKMLTSVLRSPPCPLRHLLQDQDQDLAASGTRTVLAPLRPQLQACPLAVINLCQSTNGKMLHRVMRKLLPKNHPHEDFINVDTRATNNAYAIKIVLTHGCTLIIYARGCKNQPRVVTCGITNAPNPPVEEIIRALMTAMRSRRLLDNPLIYCSMRAFMHYTPLTTNSLPWGYLGAIA